MSTLRIAMAFGLMGLVLSTPVRAQSVKEVRGWEKFQAWARVVWAHSPGTWDDVAAKVAGWPATDVRYDCSR